MVRAVSPMRSILFFGSTMGLQLMTLEGHKFIRVPFLSIILRQPKSITTHIELIHGETHALPTSSMTAKREQINVSQVCVDCQDLTKYTTQW